MQTFKDFGLMPEIVEAVTEMGFETPTPIQEKTIPILLDSEKDMVGLAQTGTGKTAAFGLPVIQNTDVDSPNIQTLILSPTRELCVQISKDLKNYAKYVKGYNIVAIYGGASVETQIKELKKNVHIVVGTPGRTIDLIKRKKLKVSNIKTLILDEADEMLNMGFKEELDKILEFTPDEKQTLLFSATMPKHIVSIAEKYMKKPEKVVIGKQNTGAENVDHVFYMVRAADRYKVLKRIADINPKIYGIVFCRTRRETKEVADRLIQDGYNADALHGDLSQAQRDAVMKKFRSKHLQILVATDVAARGIDVNDLTHIINYNLPEDPEIYTHRSGRTGRAGKKGVSIIIIHSRETRKLKQIEKIIGKEIKRQLVPTGPEICKKQLYNLVDVVENVEVDNSQIEPFLDEIYKKLSWLTREELIKRFVSVEFNRFLDYYKNAPDLNLNLSEKSDRREKKGKRRGGDENYSRFYINIGSAKGMNPANIIGLINEKTQDRNLPIGKIEIMKKFSFFEVDGKFQEKILNAFKDIHHKGVNILVEIAQPSEKKSRNEKSNFRGGGKSKNRSKSGSRNKFRSKRK